MTRKEKRDLKILAFFTSVFCQDHHQQKRVTLENLAPQLGLKQYYYCPECLIFLSYAIERRINCPLENKPPCKHCHIHCYSPEHRERVREVMRYSGKTLIRRGRLDLLWHYFF